MTAHPGAEVYLTAGADGRVTLGGLVQYKETVRSQNTKQAGKANQFGGSPLRSAPAYSAEDIQVGLFWKVVTGASLMAQMVKNLHAMQETRVQSLGWEDPLEGRAWQPTPVFLPGKSRGQRSLVGYSLWCHKRVGHDLATNNNTDHQTRLWCEGPGIR